MQWLDDWRAARYRDPSEKFGDIIMRKIIGLTIASAALLLAGCNTISGMGKDVSSVGHTVSKTADKHK